MTARILVTGASGFIGRELIVALAKAGHSVRAASRQRLSAPHPRIEPVLMPDLAAPVDWRPLLDGVDRVVHLAGIAHRNAAADDVYDPVIRAATAELAQAAARAAIGRLVFVSSIGAQTGSSAQGVLTECNEPRPASAYDRAKLAAEAEVRRAGVPFTILRPVLVYGPRPKGNIRLLLRLSRSPLPLPFAAFANRRSLLGIDNFTSAAAFVLDAPAAAGETFIVADPEALSLAEIVAALRKAMNRPPRLFRVSPHLIELGLKRLGRADLWERIGCDLVVDPGKLRACGWRPVAGTQAGLAAMVHASGDENG